MKRDIFSLIFSLLLLTSSVSLGQVNTFVNLDSPQELSNKSIAEVSYGDLPTSCVEGTIAKVSDGTVAGALVQCDGSNVWRCPDEYRGMVNAGCPPYNAVNVDTTTTGAITSGTTALTLASATSFKKGDDIIVYDAGAYTDVDDADSGWTTDDGVNVTVTHDTGDKQEGTASVKCAIGAGFTTGDVCHATISETDLYTTNDLIRFWVKSSVNTSAGDISMQFGSATSSPTTKDLEFPALTAGVWTRVTSRSYARAYAAATDEIQIYLNTDLGAQDLWIDFIEGLSPLVTSISEISGTSVTTADAASNTVTSGTVVHNNFPALSAAVNSSYAGSVYVPAGTYRMRLRVVDTGDPGLGLPNNVTFKMDQGAILLIDETSAAGSVLATADGAAGVFGDYGQIIKGGKIDGQSSLNPYGGFNAINIGDGGYDVRISDMRIVNIPGEQQQGNDGGGGIQIGNTGTLEAETIKNVQINHVSMKNLTRACLLSSYSQNVRASNIECDGVTGTSNGTLLTCDDVCIGWVIDGFYANDLDKLFSIGNGPQGSDVTIINGYISEVRRTQSIVTEDLDRFVFKNNTIIAHDSGEDSAPLLLLNGASECEISHNKFISNYNVNPRGLVEGQDISNCKINYNYIEKSLTSAINFNLDSGSGNSTNIEIIGNICNAVGDTDVVSTASCIEIDTDATHLLLGATIANNIASDSRTSSPSPSYALLRMVSPDNAEIPTWSIYGNVAVGLQRTYFQAGESDILAIPDSNDAWVQKNAFNDLETLAAASTSTSDTQFPANSNVLKTAFRITTEITGCTSVQVGDTGDSTRFGTFSTLTAGQTLVSFANNHYSSAEGILYSCVGGGGSFSAGVIRAVAWYETINPPGD